MLAAFEDAAGGRSGQRRRARFGAVLSFLLLFFVYAVLLQYWKGGFHAELSGQSDEAAHFVTGLMVHDYLTRGFPGAPLRFAQQFYLHYPKVALGHWPPGMSILLAGWMVVFPATVASSVFLMALLSAVQAFLLFRVAAREFGSTAVAGFAGVVFLSLPLLERFGGLIMADVPVALWIVCAALCWGRYLDSERARDAVLFAVFSSLAILTKGNGFLLVLLPLLTIPWMRRWSLLRKPSLWGSGALVAALCLPWTILTMKLTAPTMQYHAGWGFFERALSFYTIQLAAGSGILVFALALLGIAIWFVPGAAAARRTGLWFSMAALLVADVVFHAAVPAGLEPRYLISGAFPLVLFALLGVEWLCSLPAFSAFRRPAWAGIAVALFAVLFVAFSFRITPKYSYGFAEAAADILANPDLSHAAILCSSNRNGEGLLISEIAQRERRNGHYILRASKVLASSDWNGRDYRLRFSTAAGIDRLLDSFPVDVVVIDETPGVLHYEHNDLLLEAMRSGEWRLAGTYPRSKTGMAPDAHVEMYRRIGPARPFDSSKLSFEDLVR